MEMTLRPLHVSAALLRVTTQYDIDHGVVYKSRSRLHDGSWYVALSSWSDRYTVLADARVATEAEADILAANIRDICLLAKGGET